MRFDEHYVYDAQGNHIRTEVRSQHPVLKLALFLFVADMLRHPMGVSFVTSVCILIAGAAVVRMMPTILGLYGDWRANGDS
jgi:hypothetical protein